MLWIAEKRGGRFMVRDGRRHLPPIFTSREAAQEWMDKQINLAGFRRRFSRRLSAALDRLGQEGQQ